MSTRIYAISQFNDYDSKVLTSTITLLQARTRDQWMRGELNEAEVEFINVDTPEGAAIWDKGGSGIRVCCSSAERNDRYYLARPIRLKNLSSLFERLEAENPPAVATARRAGPAAAGPDAPTASTAAASQAVNANEPFAPNQGMLGYLFKIRDDNRHAVFHVREYAPLFPPPNLHVDGAEQVFAWADDEQQLLDLCAMPGEGLAARFVKPEDYAEQTGSAQERPLDVLIWLSAVHGSSGRPWRGLDLDAAITLNQPPNGAVLPLRPVDLALAENLIQAPRSARELAKITGQPLAVVAAFLNGCIALKLMPNPETSGAGA
ncbi:MAG: hypothetical protein WED00_13345 [Aquisalimonadaceae bacterium]